MKRVLSLQGVLAILFVIAAGIFLYLPSRSETVVDEFNIYYMFTYSALGLGFLMLVHEAGFTIATFIARIFTGSLFIVSGLIKANDPRGFGYKLEEYFREDSLGGFWSNFHDWALPLAILIASSEVVLGLAVLFGGKSRLTNWTLFAMALFFAWLTWFTASCNDSRDQFQADRALKMEQVEKECGEWFQYKDDVIDESYLPEEVAGITSCREKFQAVDTLHFDRECVNDCGCFGDALKGSIGRSLTPWESFYKDITLMFFVLVLLVAQKKIAFNTLRDDVVILPASLLAIALFAGGLFSWWFPFWFTLICIALYYLLKKWFIPALGKEWTVAIGMIIASLVFTLYCTYYLPIKDFRPYAIGHDINVERTDIPPVLKFQYLLKEKASGKEIWFDQFPENYEEKYEYVTNKSEIIDPGKDAPARDFSISRMEDGTDITDSVLHMDHALLVVAYDLTHSPVGRLQTLQQLSKTASESGMHTYLLTSTLPDQIREIASKYQLEFNFCLSDEKVLKTMIRSNPGLMYLRKGVVTEMWPGTRLPNVEEIKSLTTK